MESEVHQVISVLLLNALQSANHGGRIVVHGFVSRDWAKHRRHGIRLVVADDGQGMPADIRANLFHPFASDKEKASGLGLWTCNTIVSRYGGTIRFRSSVLRDEAERLFQFFYDHCPILLIRPTPSQQLSQSQIERIHAAMATMPP